MIRMLSISLLVGCRLGSGSGMTMPAPAAPAAPTVDRDPRPPSVRDPELVKTLPPRPATHPYVDPTPPITARPQPPPQPPPPPKPEMPDMPGM